MTCNWGLIPTGNPQSMRRSIDHRCAWGKSYRLIVFTSSSVFALGHKSIFHRMHPTFLDLAQVGGQCFVNDKVLSQFLFANATPLFQRGRCSWLKTNLKALRTTSVSMCACFWQRWGCSRYFSLQKSSGNAMLDMQIRPGSG